MLIKNIYKNIFYEKTISQFYALDVTGHNTKTVHPSINLKITSIIVMSTTTIITTCYR